MKDKSLLFTKILYGVLAAWTILLLIIIKININSSFSKIFGFGYITLVLFSLIYVPIITFRNAKKAQKIYVKKAFKSFVISYISTFAFFFILNLFFNKFTITNMLIKSLGISFGTSFWNITMLNKKYMK